MRFQGRSGGSTVRPNPSLKRSANGRPPGPATGYGVHSPVSGPGVLPVVARLACTLGVMNTPMHHNLPHWQYFRMLEGDLLDCFQYIQPVQTHFNVYSDRFARIILLACAEIENCLDGFASNANALPKPENISQYQAFIQGRCPLFSTMKVDIPRCGLELVPWENWTQSTAPDWWTNGYNKLKHDRLRHPDAPSFHRALSSVAALLVVLLHYYRALHGRDCQMPAELFPQIFMPHEEDDGIYGPARSWFWTLPGETAI